MRTLRLLANRIASFHYPRLGMLINFFPCQDVVFGPVIFSEHIFVLQNASDDFGDFFSENKHGVI